MKSLVGLSLLALGRLVAAQNSACLSLTTLFPVCAYSCITSAGSEVGCTVSTDVACRCQPAASSKIQEKAFACVIGGCQASDINSALKAGGEMCRCVATAPPDPKPTPTHTATTSDTPPEPTQTSNSVPTTAPPTGTSNTNTAPPSHTTQPPQTTCDIVSPCQKSADAVPDCAEKCIMSAAVTKASCLSYDFQCQCASSAVIQQAAQGCVIEGCGIDTALQALQSVSAMCKCVTASPTSPCKPEPTNTNTDKPSSNTHTNTTGEPPKPTDTNTHKPSETCAGGTKSDCAPVASTAVPKCAQACFSSAAPKVGCEVTDFACQCEAEAQASLSQILVPCVATACPAAELPAVITGAASVCACANAPPAGGNCPTKTEQPPHSTNTHEPPKPTGTGTQQPPQPSCKPGTAKDCGPVASSAVPKCAQPCFTSAAPGVGCSVDDYACQCKPDAQASLSQLLIPCVATACQPADIPSVIAGASSVCACASAAPGGGDCPPGPTGQPPAPTGEPPVPTTRSGGGGGGGGGGGSLTTKVPVPVPQPTQPGQPGESSPAVVVPGAAARFEVGLVAGVFGVVWLVAIAL